MENIKNKTVLITGAASGIGYKYAEYLLRNGAKSVAILDLSTSTGEKAVTTLEKQFGKGRVVFFACDVSNAEMFGDCFKKVVETFGGLDILINNAGILNDVAWEKTISLNVNALIRGSLLALDFMGKHKGGKGGTIVNIASIVGLHPVTWMPAYTASKFAVVGFSRSIQDFYDKTGVRVLVICPGVTQTQLFDNLKEKHFDFIGFEEAVQGLKSLPAQEADNVAEAMVELIQKGKNGAVWVSEGGETPYAVDFPHYSKLKVPM